MAPQVSGPRVSVTGWGGVGSGATGSSGEWDGAAPSSRRADKGAAGGGGSPGPLRPQRCLCGTGGGTPVEGGTPGASHALAPCVRRGSAASTKRRAWGAGLAGQCGGAEAGAPNLCRAGGGTGVTDDFRKQQGGCWPCLPKTFFTAAVPGMDHAPHGGAEDTSLPTGWTQALSIARLYLGSVAALQASRLPQCPTSMCQQQNGVNDNSVLLEPRFLPVSKVCWQLWQVPGRAPTTVVPGGCARGGNSHGLFLLWQTCLSAACSRPDPALSQLWGSYGVEENVLAMGINGIINKECEEGRGKGLTGGLSFQVKLLLVLRGGNTDGLQS